MKSHSVEIAFIIYLFINCQGRAHLAGRVSCKNIFIYLFIPFCSRIPARPVLAQVKKLVSLTITSTVSSALVRATEILIVLIRYTRLLIRTNTS
jgi:hypothetical protein